MEPRDPSQLPDPVAEPPEFRARRLIQLGDTEWAKDANENHIAFISTFPELRLRAEPLTAEQLKIAVTQWDKFKELSRFAEDFYDAYYVSSGHLTNCFGPALVLKCFQLLAPYYKYLKPPEWEMLQSMPNELVVFRGGRPPMEDLQRGISWTTWKECSERYMDSPGDLVIKGKIRTDRVLAYFPEVEECILNPVDLVGTVEIAQEFAQPPKAD